MPPSATTERTSEARARTGYRVRYLYLLACQSTYARVEQNMNLKILMFLAHGHALAPCATWPATGPGSQVTTRKSSTSWRAGPETAARRGHRRQERKLPGYISHFDFSRCGPHRTVVSPNCVLRKSGEPCPPAGSRFSGVGLGMAAGPASSCPLKHSGAFAHRDRERRESVQV